MAYTKKAKTETETTTTETVEITKVETVDTEIKEEKKERVFKETDPILCTSITAGKLGMIGLKTGINYTWAGRGDETEVEYQDLVAAIRSGKRHITEPFFIINDEDFLAKFPQVKKIYGEMYSIGDLRKVITDLDAASMKVTIENLPAGAKESVKNIASSMIAKGQIDSVKKIGALDEIYGTKFMLMTELF